MDKVADLFSWVRRNRVKITDISYGSGGFSVSIMDLRSGKTITAYSWDADDALNKAKNDLNEIGKDVDVSEDITDPGRKAHQK